MIGGGLGGGLGEPREGILYVVCDDERCYRPFISVCVQTVWSLVGVLNTPLPQVHLVVGSVLPVLKPRSWDKGWLGLVGMGGEEKWLLRIWRAKHVS